MKIIPAIDIIEGKCVRLTKGDYSTKKVYNENPLEVAKMFEDIGIKYLHVVDLDGAKSSHIVNWKILEKICNNTSLDIDFGGGLKSNKDVEIAFNCGANQITGGSIAVSDKKEFTEWIKKYGADKIILGADVNNEKIAINGWKEKTKIDIFDFIDEYLEYQIKDIICTDISKDGMLEGCSIDLYSKLLNKYMKRINLIASGGVTTIRELYTLKDEQLHGCIIGKALYEGNITLKEIEIYNSKL